MPEVREHVFEVTALACEAGFHTNTAVAADFTGDGLPDVVANSGGKVRLFVAPNWKEIVLDDNPQHNCIHSETFDVDGDGDPDVIQARYSPGLIFWLECPEKPLTDRWGLHLIDDQVNGIHGLLVGDIDRDGTLDLLANLLQRKDPALHLSSTNVGSLAGLLALKRTEAHIAGSHLLDEETGEYNLPYVERLLPG